MERPTFGSSGTCEVFLRGPNLYWGGTEARRALGSHLIFRLSRGDLHSYFKLRGYGIIFGLS